jgi:hypothetical protein
MPYFMVDRQSLSENCEKISENQDISSSGFGGPAFLGP